MDKNEIKELRDFGVQLLTIGCLSPGQIKRLCELIGDACFDIERLEAVMTLPDLMKDGLLAVGQELIRRDMRIKELEVTLGEATIDLAKALKDRMK